MNKPNTTDIRDALKATIALNKSEPLEKIKKNLLPCMVVVFKQKFGVSLQALMNIDTFSNYKSYSGAEKSIQNGTIQFEFLLELSIALEMNFDDFLNTVINFGENATEMKRIQIAEISQPQADKINKLTKLNQDLNEQIIQIQKQLEHYEERDGRNTTEIEFLRKYVESLMKQMETLTKKAFAEKN